MDAEDLLLKKINKKLTKLAVDFGVKVEPKPVVVEVKNGKRFTNVVSVDENKEFVKGHMRTKGKRQSPFQCEACGKNANKQLCSRCIRSPKNVEIAKKYNLNYEKNKQKVVDSVLDKREDDSVSSFHEKNTLDKERTESTKQEE